MKKVFIIGAHRSGTTKLASYFSEVLGFAGAAEGHVFRLVANLIDGRAEIEKSIPKKAYEVNKIGFDRIIVSMVQTLDSLVSEHHKKCDFFDKTPGFRMISATQMIKRAIPESKFIYMQRNGIANINSNLRAWPTRRFSGACEMWAKPVAAYLQVKEALGNDLISFEMSDMVSDPWAFHNAIANHVGLHSIWSRSDIESYFQIPSRSSKTKSRPELEAPTLAEQLWSDEEKDIFEQICGNLMRTVGYEY